MALIAMIGTLGVIIAVWAGAAPYATQGATQGERGLKGDPGEKGPSGGLPGPPGKDGKDGIDGINGINGINGTNGTNGLAGTEVGAKITTSNLTSQNAFTISYVHGYCNANYAIFTVGGTLGRGLLAIDEASTFGMYAGVYTVGSFTMPTGVGIGTMNNTRRYTGVGSCDQTSNIQQGSTTTKFLISVTMVGGNVFISNLGTQLIPAPTPIEFTISLPLS